MKYLLKFFLLIFLINMLILPVAAKQRNIIFAQVTDLNYSGSQESVDNYNRLIESLNKDKQIKFVVFTGNNINKPSAELLKVFLKKTKKIKVPYYIQVGNEESFKSSDLTKKIYLKYVNQYSLKFLRSFNYSFKKDNVVFVMVDGSREVLPAPNGYYKESTLNWLDNVLTKYKEHNIIILQHYPVSDIAKDSLQNLYKPELYQELLSKHKNIVAIFAGHYQLNREEIVNDVLYVTTDSAQVGKSNYRKIFLAPEGNKNIEVYSQVVKF